MTCSRCKGLGSYWSGHQGGMWLACEHDEPEQTHRLTHDDRPILTEHVCPPIPTRDMDWMAWIDGEEEFGSGHGATEEEAIKEIREMWEDHHANQ